MNFANIMKILPGVLKLGEVASIAANDGYQSQTSKALGGLSQAAGIISSVVPSSGTTGKPNTGTTGKPMPSNPNFKGKAQTQGPQGEALTRGLENNRKQLLQQNKKREIVKDGLSEVGKRNLRIRNQGKPQDMSSSALMRIEPTGRNLDDKFKVAYLSGGMWS